VLIVCLVVCFALTLLITKTGWTFLIIKALITVAVYIMFFWIFGTNKEEKQYIIITFKNILYKLLGKQ
jgi:hypothetical protein